MARKYVNPAKSASVDDQVLAEARTKAEAAAARLREAERADPLAPSWPAEYEAATTAARAASRRVEALEQLRAAQLERGGQRATAVKATAPEGHHSGAVSVPGSGRCRRCRAPAVAGRAHVGGRRTQCAAG